MNLQKKLEDMSGIELFLEVVTTLLATNRILAEENRFLFKENDEYRAAKSELENDLKNNAEMYQDLSERHQELVAENENLKSQYQQLAADNADLYKRCQGLSDINKAILKELKNTDTMEG